MNKATPLVTKEDLDCARAAAQNLGVAIFTFDSIAITIKQAKGPEGLVEDFVAHWTELDRLKKEWEHAFGSQPNIRDAIEFANRDRGSIRVCGIDAATAHEAVGLSAGCRIRMREVYGVGVRGLLPEEWGMVADAIVTMCGGDAVFKLPALLTEEFNRALGEISTSGRRDGGTTDETAVDGPFGLNGFRWQTCERIGMEPLPWKLIRHLWSTKDRTATYTDLAVKVWDDVQRNLRNGDELPSARKKANKFFEAGPFPFRVKLSPKREVAALVQTATAIPAKPKAGKKAPKSPHTARQ